MPLAVSERATRTPIALDSRGPYTEHKYRRVQYEHDFLAYISSEEHKAPLDFFSWHSYSQPARVFEEEDYCRRMLAKYGFDHVEGILNEWNPTADAELRSTPLAAARVLAMMLGMQKTRVDMLMYYDARIGAGQYGGMFNSDTWKPYLTYFAFMMFNDVYKLENEVESASDDSNVAVCAAAKDGKSVLLISNLGDETVAELSLDGADLTSAEVLMIDGTYHYSPTGKRIDSGKLTLPKHSCVEIRFFNAE